MQMLLNEKENIVKDTPQHFSSFLLQTRAKLQKSQAIDYNHRAGGEE
jgi:hypothetical protein